MFWGILNSIPSALSQGVLWGVMVLGVYITFKILDHPDLTVDGSFALGGMISAVLITKGYNPFVSLLFATMMGFVAGFITGILHTKLKIPAILSGILMMIALYSINLRISGGVANIALNKLNTFLTQINDIPYINNLGRLIKIGGLTISVKVIISILVGIIICAIVITFMYWFFGTEIGSIIRATGCNEQMVRAQGSNTDNMKILGLGLSNALVALSGGLIAQSQGYGDIGMGVGTIVIGLAAVIIGEVLFCHKPHSFAYSLTAVVLGSIIYYIIIGVVLQLGLKTNDLKLLTATLVALALSIPTIKDIIKKMNRVKTVPDYLMREVDSDVRD